jgi:hypothetical protein
MALLQRIQERIPLTGNEVSFIDQQKLMNMCDSLKDGYSITGKCNTTFKEVLSTLYGVPAPGNYTIPLGKMEGETDALATLGPPPEKKSFLRIEYRGKAQPIKENHLPEYVTQLVQDSGYKPSTIQPSGKTVLLCYSEFDPAGREIHDVEHWGPAKGETFTLGPDILNLLGLPNTSIKCTRIKDDILRYSLDISGPGYTVGDTVTIPTRGPSTFGEGKYFIGNPEKNKAIMDLCDAKKIDDKEIKKYAIAKLLGDKLQVIGSLQYIISRQETNDSVCLFTTDKVVAMLSRILGVSCCLQDHDDDEDAPAKEVKMCRVKYYPTRQDPVALYEAQIDREVEMCKNHNNEVRTQIRKVLFGEPLLVGSTRITIDNVRTFLEGILATIDSINIKIEGYSVTSKNLTPAISLLQIAQAQDVSDKYTKGLQEFKVIANSLKVNMIVSLGKALQSASRLFQKGVDLVDLPDPIATTGKTFGVHLLNLNGGNDNEYKKTYATMRFLDAAKDAIVLLKNGLTPLLPAVEAAAEAAADADAESVEPPPIKRTDIGDMSESEDGSDLGSGLEMASGTQPHNDDEMQSDSGSAALAAQTESIGFDSYPAASYPAVSLPPSQMVSPERPPTGTKTPRNEPTNQPNASQKLLRRSLEGELNQTNQTNQKGGYKFLRNDDIYPTLSGGLNDNTAAIDFCYDNDEYDILYLLYSFLTYLGETPWTPEVIEFLILQIITKDLSLVELEEVYKARYQEEEQPQEGGKPKRKTRKRKEPKLKGILKTRNKKKYEAKTRRSKRKTRK